MGRPAQGLGLALPTVLVAEEEAVLEPAVAGGLYASNSESGAQIAQRLQRLRRSRCWRRDNAKIARSQWREDGAGRSEQSA